MSLASTAARSAAWTIVFGLVARAIGVAGTLVMTYLVAPAVIGEVAAASIMVMVFSWVSDWGFGQYLVIEGRGAAEREVIWHCAVASLLFGAVAMVAVSLVGGDLLSHFGAAGGAAYVPGMAVAFGLRRLASLPEKILMQQMRFRAIGLSVFVGEITYVGVTLLLAARGHGGMAVVIGNIAQGAALLVVVLAASGIAWLRPVPLRRARFAAMVRFGVPVGIEGVAHYASRYLDKIWMSRYFGAGPMALYSMGYNLADIPATYVGEQIGQVMLPSLAQLPHERRAAALERSAGLLALIMFPMAVGLATVADPLIAVALSAEWQGVAPLLMILAAVSVFRPVTWLFGAYFQATGQAGKLMHLELAKLVVLLGGIAVLETWGIQAAAAAVGVAFAFHAIVGAWMIAHGPPPCPSPRRILIALAQPALASAAMAAVVLATRHGLDAIGVVDPRATLPLEIVVGAIAYVAAAFAFAGPIARDLVHVLRSMRKSK